MDEQAEQGAESELPPFKKSESFVQKVEDFIHRKFSKNEIWGSVTLIAQIVLGRFYEITQGFDREDKAQGIHKDWTRIVSGGMAAVNDIIYFASSRQGNLPKGDNFAERMAYTARHPNQSSVHARFLFAVPAAVLKTAGNLYYGLHGLETEKARLQNAFFTTLLSGLQLWSMYKPAKPDPTEKEMDAEAESDEVSQKSKAIFQKSTSKIEYSNFVPLKWLGYAVRHQSGLLVAYLLELAIQVTLLEEGIKKMKPGPVQNVKEGQSAIKKASITSAIATSNFFYNVHNLVNSAAKAPAGAVR